MYSSNSVKWVCLCLHMKIVKLDLDNVTVPPPLLCGLFIWDTSIHVIT